MHSFFLLADWHGQVEVAGADVNCRELDEWELSLPNPWIPIFPYNYAGRSR
jgi:hypothetical protein